MFLTKYHLSRRAVLRGLGVSIGLPFLDAMLPAQTPLNQTAAAPKVRFVAIEMVHGAAGSSVIGRSKNYWSPARTGSGFEFTPTLKSLEPLREYITIVSNTELHNAMSLSPGEDGPMTEHARSSAVFLTAAHPKQTAGPDIEAGPSIDQIYARRIGAETPIASLQLGIEHSTMAGACGSGYSCAYTNTISWASPKRPLPMEVNPLVVFQRLFGAPVFGYGEGSILDRVPDAAGRLKRRLGAPDVTRLNAYLDSVRAVERRLQMVRQLTDLTFEEHVQLMFDLQRLAFSADITRVSTFKMSIDRSSRVYPESGVDKPFHALSHHGDSAENVEQFARLNQYHVSQVAKFLRSLADAPDGDGNLLDHSLVLYGSPMGDSNVHAHRNLPLFLAGRASGTVRGNQHIACAEDTPMANLLLAITHKLGVNSSHIGDSTGETAL
jgi:Protein of unknown function (DUF1552)